MFDEIILNNKQNIINTLCELIKFKSVSTETNDSTMPFGKECKHVLDYTLNLANSLGFRTKNLDGYCGYIEFGKGNEIVGILGHLDVVPANESDGWTTPPFSPEIRDNKLYGRGSIDDKGPVTASLYAMKAVLDSSVKLNRRVRLILGLNEEKNWKCINHYKEIGEESPTIGFSPDAEFPTIYAEKGILSIRLSKHFEFENFEILEIDCNNNAINVVPKYCSITLKYNTQENKILFENDDKVTVENIDDKTIKITATGISAHAAHPNLGENAITRLLKYLNKYLNNDYISKLSDLGIFEITSPKFLSDKPIEDDSGILTSNVGFLDYENGNLEIGLNLRVPVNTHLSQIEEKYMNLKDIFSDLTIKFPGEQPSIYIPKNSYLVKTLTEIFNEKTGSNEEPLAIGGGTYARAFPNIVAFGANMPGHVDLCHQVDEYIDIDTLIDSAKIYAEAIYRLGK